MLILRDLKTFTSFKQPKELSPTLFIFIKFIVLHFNNTKEKSKEY